MVTTIQADKLTLHDLKTQFGLEYTENEDFFSEWQHNLPELSELEKQSLDEMKAEFRHFSKYTVLEPIVKMIVLPPLLRVAGFFHEPFNLTAEKSIEIISEDEETMVRGRLDLLVFVPEFWILVVEAKGLKYSVEAGIPQLLAYMLGSPNQNKPIYGFVTNGPTFKFLKLIKQDKPIYSDSYEFYINRSDDIYRVGKILKHLAQLNNY